MAIQSKEKFFGAEAQEAYSRISSILIETQRAVIQVQTWFNAQAATPVSDSNGLEQVQPPVGGFALEVTGQDLANLLSLKVPGGGGKDDLKAQAYRLLMQSPRFTTPVAV